MPRLNSHGEHKMRHKAQIIYVESLGPWNVEYFYEFHKEMFELVKTIQHKPYAVLISIVGTGIPVKEGIELHKEFVKLSNAKAVAIELSKCTTKSLTQKLFSEVYSTVGLNFQIFDDKSSAQSWLNAALVD